MGWMWKGKRGWRVVVPGQPDYFEWRNHRRLSKVQQQEFDEALAW